MSAAAEARTWARSYETIYILRPSVTQDEAQKVSDRVSEVITRLEGTITKVDNWGRRKLAYTIAKNTRGIFVYVQYVGYSDVVAELERNLRLLEQVIRYQTIVLDKFVDPKAVSVDAEETQFLPIEEADDEPEPDTATRLGMAPEPEVEEEEEEEAAEGEAAEGEKAEGEAAEGETAEAAKEETPADSGE